MIGVCERQLILSLAYTQTLALTPPIYFRIEIFTTPVTEHNLRLYICLNVYKFRTDKHKIQTITRGAMKVLCRIGLRNTILRGDGLDEYVGSIDFTFFSLIPLTHRVRYKRLQQRTEK